ncbi:hypothetical protein SIM91_43385 [Rhodococcus opacus]|uniref:hypothetical protein n=1 Tax=Rhodococcus opacus TaxID=37919 RepID=UPI0002A1C057|nr:hypothetical protein [Rhodococcus opacus]ELB86283.1 hypothetical protein Rwratislav_45815 [Rhodococcus wratislaviensis IFP 2016]MDX5970007.1 hypothetical protein [Rhodococcus opacus]
MALSDGRDDSGSERRIRVEEERTTPGAAAVSPRPAVNGDDTDDDTLTTGFLLGAHADRMGVG